MWCQHLSDQLIVTENTSRFQLALHMRTGVANIDITVDKLEAWLVKFCSLG